jgi:hypothetical protein
MTTWVSRRLMGVTRTWRRAYVRWMSLSPNEVQSPLSLAKCNARSTPFVFLTDGNACRCKRQFAKYACPRCNIPYCSLMCFRSEVSPLVLESVAFSNHVLRFQGHNQCSEGFYRDQIQSDIKTAPSATAQERLKMMELLKRFEESSAEEADLDDGGDGEDGLAQRLKGIDLGISTGWSHPASADLPLLDSVPPDELWNLLPEEQRAKFLRTVENPSSDLAKQLLADGGFLHKNYTPWWKSREDSTVECPPVMSIPQTVVEKMPNDGPPLLYNICAVWCGPLNLSAYMRLIHPSSVVYSYVCRHFQVSCLTDASTEEADGIKGILSSVAHFVTDRKSKIIYAGVSAIVTDIWSRQVSELMPPPTPVH